MRRVLAGLVVLALAAGCGGGGGLSKEEYRTQADAICARYSDALEKVQDEIVRAESPEEQTKAIDRGVATVKKGIAELRDLDAPDDLDEDVDRWLDLNDENVENLEDLRDAVKEGDAEQAQEAAERGQETERKSDEVAREIGLDDCASDE